MAQQQTQPDPDQLYESYGRNLYKTTGEEGTDDILDILSADMSANNSSNVQTSASDLGGGVSGATTTQATGGATQQGKSTFDNTVPGYILGVDPATGNAKFYIGNTTSYLNWNGDTGTLSIQGEVALGNIVTIGPTNSIQTAITLLSSTGGIIYLEAGTYTEAASITLASGVSIIGAGIDATIIDFNSTTDVLQGTGIGNFALQGFTVQNSHNTTAAINLTQCSNFSVLSVKSTANWGEGFRCDRCNAFVMQNCTAYLNDHATTNHGFRYMSDVSIVPQQILYSNCFSRWNGGYGFYLGYGQSTFTAIAGPFTVQGCFATQNSFDGFHTENTAGACTFQPLIQNCVAYNNKDQAGLRGAPATTSNNGFSNTMPEVSYILNQAYTNGLTGFATTVALNTFLGNTDSGSGVGVTYTYLEEPSGTYTFGTFPPFSIEDRVYETAENISGGTLTQGQCVIYAPTSVGIEISTTTTVGDNRVIGMIFDASITNTNAGRILVKGGTSLLKVNGTVDIAIGDPLCTYSTAGIAQKASAGNTVFAFALGAYTTNDSLGVIPALLVSPRLI